MDTQYITNGKGEKTAVIIPTNEYEDLLHQHHLNLELSDGYKTMIDKMLKDENEAKYISGKDVKKRFCRNKRR